MGLALVETDLSHCEGQLILARVAQDALLQREAETVVGAPALAEFERTMAGLAAMVQRDISVSDLCKELRDYEKHVLDLALW